MNRAAIAGAVTVVVIAAGVGIAVAVGSGGSGSSGAKGLFRSPESCSAPAAAAPSAAGPVQTPPNSNAFIFNNFGDNPYDIALVNHLTSTLGPTGEHYNVTVFNNPTEGREGPGTATLTNFLSMVCGGVVVIDSHATDQSTDPGLPIIPAPGTKGIGRVVSGPLETGGILVEWWQTKEEVTSHLLDYIQRDGMQPAWLFTSCGERITGKGLVRVPPSACGTGTRAPTDNTGGWGIGLTAAGLSHFFGGHQIGILYVVACHSLSLAPLFNAASYFGYSDVCFARNTTPDEQLLFDRLAGRQSIDRRTTVGAFAPRGFSGPLGLGAGARPVTLSPAVTQVGPADGTLIAAGQQTPAEITFDTGMQRASLDSLVTATGCDAKLTNGRWLDGTHFAFTINTPANPPPGRVELRINHTAAVAAEPGWPSQLDGNQEPPGSQGVAPNDDDYVWDLNCTHGPAPTTVTTSGAGGVTVEYKGMYKARSYEANDNGKYVNPIDVSLSWDATSTFDPQRGTATPWHYSALTGGIMLTVTDPLPGVPAACTINLAEAPGFESNANDQAQIFAAGAGMLTVHPEFPYHVAGLLSASGTVTDVCSTQTASPGYQILLGNLLNEFNAVTVPTITVPFRSPSSQDFNFPGYSESDGNVAYTSRVQVS